MAKRDYVAEIIDQRKRLRRRAPRFHEMLRRLDGIIAIANFVRDSSPKEVPFRDELAKYVAIGTVACIEGYFRLVFRDLIDHGSPFRENVAKFKEMRLGIDYVVALQSRKVTLGEFVGHLLPASNLNDIHESMSTLIGEPFLDRFKVTKAQYFTGEAVSLADKGLVDAAMRDIKSLFDQRHIFAHELATKAKPKARDLAVDYAAGMILIWGTEAMVNELLSPAT